MLIAYIISFIVIAFACGLVVGWMIEKAMVEERIQIIEDRARLLSSMVNHKNNELEKLKEQQMGEAEDFCKKMHEQGMKWNDGKTYLGHTNFDSYFDQMCYCGDGEYSSLKYAKEKGYKILEWSNYMQKEFTKADLKDGMVIEYKDGRRRLVLNNRLIGKDGYYELNKYTEDMKDKESSERDIMRVFKIDIITTLDRIFHIDNLELIWERKKTKRMTVEEMRQKLEELTGDKIETEPSREEMIGTCHEYCRERRCSKSCVLYQFGDCCFKNYPDEKLKQCYVKVLEDGRKES